MEETATGFSTMTETVRVGPKAVLSLWISCQELQSRLQTEIVLQQTVTYTSTGTMYMYTLHVQVYIHVHV